MDRVEEQMRQTDARLKELGEATDARVAALTGAIGQYIREMHERDQRRPN